jgi:response regulator of citrate/malate metabolism
MVKTKRTSEEVTAATERKAALQRQADELEQKRIDTLVEMELEEEEEERTVVRKLAHADSLDDVEDVVMQSEDEEDKGTSVTEEIVEFSASEEEAKVVKAKTIAPKKKSQVCL